jgi:type IV pilus assembly protein PilA
MDRQLLEAAIGRNAGYYLRRFEAIDAGRRGGWNWPAFFFSTAWFSYRGLGGWAALNFIAPWVTWVVAVLVAVSTDGFGMLIVLMAYLAGFYVLVPMYANALYYRRIKRVVAQAAAGGKLPSPTRTGAAVTAGLAVVALPTLLGMVAVPAHVSTSSRAQVAEAVSLIGGARTPLAEYFADKGKWPTNLKEVAENTSGRYTERVEITSGAGAASGALVITATMKKEGVRSDIAGKTVQYRSEDGGKTWICSRGPTNGVENKYLPAACR